VTNYNLPWKPKERLLKQWLVTNSGWLQHGVSTTSGDYSRGVVCLLAHARCGRFQCFGISHVYPGKRLSGQLRVVALVR